METPDKWIILKIKNNYKVFSTWYGGYLGSDSWKLNSGIKEIIENDVYIDFIGYSGSVYRCQKQTYGTSTYSNSVLNNMIEKCKNMSIDIEVLNENTNWSNLLK